MTHEAPITLGSNMNPPVVDSELTKDIYDCVRTDEFEVAVFNSLLMAVVVYCDTHRVEYNDGGLPWAEDVGREQ